MRNIFSFIMICFLLSGCQKEETPIEYTYKQDFTGTWITTSIKWQGVSELVGLDSYLSGEISFTFEDEVSGNFQHKYSYCEQYDTNIKNHYDPILDVKFEISNTGKITFDGPTAIADEIQPFFDHPDILEFFVETTHYKFQRQ